jgi:adenosylcobalamin phosphodiesterase
MRLGTTSFIYPGSWLHNVQRLGPDYDDVELLFFEDHDAAYPGVEERRGLLRCKRDLELTYSLHTPLSASLASEDEPRRRLGVASVLRALDVASSLEPENVVVHVYHGDGEHTEERPRDLQSWRQRAAESLAAIIASGVPAQHLCVERLDYDYALIEPVVRALGVSVALDVGHLVRDGADELGELERWLGQTRIVQWHGTDPSGRDHRALEHYPLERARSLLRALRDARYAGVLTLEVFREADLTSSRALVDQLLAELDPPFLPSLVRAAAQPTPGERP